MLRFSAKADAADASSTSGPTREGASATRRRGSSMTRAGPSSATKHTGDT